MDDRVDAVDRGADGVSVGKGRSNDLARNAVGVLEPADGEVVEDADPIATTREEARYVRADEAGSAGDEDQPTHRLADVDPVRFRLVCARSPGPAGSGPNGRPG